MRYHVEVNVKLEVEAVKDNHICESENKVQKPLPWLLPLNASCVYETETTKRKCESTILN